jgi:hypothetical protein
MPFGKRELDQVYRQMIALADTQKHVTDEELATIASAVREEARHIATPIGYGHGV